MARSLRSQEGSPPDSGSSFPKEEAEGDEEEVEKKTGERGKGRLRRR